MGQQKLISSMRKIVFTVIFLMLTAAANAQLAFYNYDLEAVFDVPGNVRIKLGGDYRQQESSFMDSVYVNKFTVESPSPYKIVIICYTRDTAKLSVCVSSGNLRYMNEVKRCDGFDKIEIIIGKDYWRNEYEVRWYGNNQDDLKCNIKIFEL